MEASLNEAFQFMWFDYGLFFIMLGLSILIGLYFGCCGHQDNANEYLLGGKTMSILPIATSLLASNVSGFMLMAVPADVYRFGVSFYTTVLTYLPAFLITCYVFVPVFFNLQLFSTYEYLSLRFDRKIRLLASFLYTINSLLALPIVAYVPALALSQATRINIHIITPILCIVCIFYTAIGGLKAVVWTDTLQFFVMIGAMFGVLFVAVKSVGGFGNIWSKSYEGGRLDFDFDFDPTKRDTVPSVFFGGLFRIIGNLISQGCVQKYLALPNAKSVKRSVALLLFGLFLVLSYIFLIGLCMYARYFDCDPFAIGKIKVRDQILPYFVLDVAREIPGLAGLFLSGVFSAGLSTLSANLNSLSGTIYEDFLSAYMPREISQKRISNILKGLVVIIGLISTGLVFGIEKMGSIFPVQSCLDGITSGPLLGLFIIGMVFPCANTKGALFGGLGGMAVMAVIIGGNQITQLKGQWSYPDKPISIMGCSNVTDNIDLENLVLKEAISPSDVAAIFKITFFLFSLLGTVSTIIIGLIVSLLTKENNFQVDKNLISPVSHWMIKEKTKPEA